MENPKIQVVLPDEYTDQLYQQFLGIANEAVRHATENVGMTNKKYLNEKELRSYLNVGQSTINELLEQDLISYSKVGRQKLYKISDVEQAIDSLKF